jgi:hypothetical protein
MVLEAFSVSHGKASAYLPVLELLREYLRINAADDPRARREISHWPHPRARPLS